MTFFASRAGWEIEQGFMAAASLIGGLLVLIPLTWFLQAWNVGCVLYIFWTSLVCILQFVNNMIWRDNARNVSPIFCDICEFLITCRIPTVPYWDHYAGVRVQWAAGMGIISAGLVIARRVALITAASNRFQHNTNGRRMMYIDLVIGLVPPLLQIALFFVQQGHRFDVYEGIGCYPAIPPSIISICLTSVTCLIIGIVSAAYCFQTLRGLYRRHRMIDGVLSDVGVSTDRYYRLLIMAILEPSCTIPISIYNLVLSVQYYYPWRGFADLHFGFDRVDQFPYELWTAQQSNAPLREEWYQTGCALVFFLIFGTTREAFKRYRAAFRWVAERLGVKFKQEVEEEGSTFAAAPVSPRKHWWDTTGSSYTMNNLSFASASNVSSNTVTSKVNPDRPL
ncbi:STE3-domain-containing protein [Panus rudis PR-1116 ss-1]|nr:STE3-domain-containing protein [Panus rudis PR-1116 ss-1]